MQHIYAMISPLSRCAGGARPGGRAGKNEYRKLGRGRREEHGTRFGAPVGTAHPPPTHPERRKRSCETAGTNASAGA